MLLALFWRKGGCMGEERSLFPIFITVFFLLALIAFSYVVYTLITRSVDGGYTYKRCTFYANTHDEIYEQQLVCDKFVK